LIEHIVELVIGLWEICIPKELQVFIRKRINLFDQLKLCKTVI